MNPAGPQQYTVRRPKSGVIAQSVPREMRPRRPNQPGAGAFNQTLIFRFAMRA